MHSRRASPPVRARSLRRLATGALGLLLLVPAPVCAQVALHGRVIEDADGGAIAGASVVVRDVHGQTLGRRLTDEWGQFSFPLTAGASIMVLVEAVGYQTVESPELALGDYDMLRVEVRLSRDAVLLAPLEVVARSRSGGSPALAAFHERRLAGTGWFLTREEIEARRASRLSDLLSAVPGLWFQPLRGARGRVVYLSRATDCPAQIYLDGFHMNRRIGAATVPGRRGTTGLDGVAIDDIVQPKAIEGLEVYQGLSRVPSEFLGPDAECGVVAIWTRRD